MDVIVEYIQIQFLVKIKKNSHFLSQFSAVFFSPKIWMSDVKLVVARRRRRRFWRLPLLKHYVCLFFISFIAKSVSSQMHVVSTDIGTIFLKLHKFLKVGSSKLHHFFPPLGTAETCSEVKQRLCQNEQVFGTTGLQVFVGYFTTLRVRLASNSAMFH